MYNQFYGFSELPFSITPDSTFFYASQQHMTALDAMTYAVRQRKGFVVITGPVGSGKTTVVRTLLRRLDDNVKTAVITNTHLSPKGVLMMLLEDLGVTYKDGSKERLFIQLNHYLIRQVMDGHNVVLVVDEAQNLTLPCLEELRMLSNLETEKEKLIQIILIGQPELRKKLEMPELEQLRQRVAVHYHLVALNQEETRNYVRHRLKTAQANGRDMTLLFEEDTYSMIYDFSRGIPRMINVLCDHILLTGFVKEAPVITRDIVEESVAEIRFQGEKHYEQV